ncbi:unnamed protein product [Lathyrus sativus]|nr:unnamed protein product [Lathyrus sativus]
MSSSEVKLSPAIKLSSSQKSSRDKAIRILLKSWRSRHLLPQNVAKKLWKGIFYCVYYSDKSLVQADLIDRIASYLSTFRHPSRSLQYFSTFFLTMRHEWSGINSVRLDKFYLLIRRFISNAFSLLDKNSWNLELVNLVMNCLDKSTFSAKDKFVKGKGKRVNYYVASVFLQELMPFLPVKLSVLQVLFRPFFSAVVKLRDKVLLGKIKSWFFDVLLMNGRILLEVKKSGCGDAHVVNLGTIALVMGFSSKLFELASDPGCVQSNRQVLFELHNEFLKLEKDVFDSGFEFSIPDSVDRVVLDSVDKVKKPKKKKRKIKKSDAEACLDDGVATGVVSKKRKRTTNSKGETSQGVVCKKRKRTENSKGETSQDFDLNTADVEDVSALAKSREKSSKNVKFSMESNLVWKQHTPLPPQSLRIPPSATPRGSALKKGLPPGPIREMPLPTKKVKQKKSKKTRKLLKEIVDFAKAFMR